MFRKFAAALAVILLSAGPAAAQTAKPEPIKVLMVSGGGFHDYATQRAILEEGLKTRINVAITHVFYDMKPEDNQERPKLPIFTNPNYADGFNVVIHNECAAGMSEPEVVDTVLAPHRKGVAGVNLHCAMHSYRSGTWRQPVTDGADNARWFEYTGIQSTSHGPQAPIVLTAPDAANPLVKGLEMWTTPTEELYNNLRNFGVTPVVTGLQPTSPDPAKRGAPLIVAWTHLYGPSKARVFSTTLAHNESSMKDPRYLDLVARGVLWATGHLTEDGKPAPGYAAR